MNSSMWSGPSRALQFHLSLYENVAEIFKYLASLPGTPNGDGIYIDASVDQRTMPIQLKQRLRLMTASSGTEGSSVVNLRDNVGRMFDQDNFDRTQHTMRSEYMALDQGETHYVSHSVQQSVLAAAEAMEAEPLFATDLPCPSGVIVFEYPLMTDDLHPDTGETVPGLLMPVRAISWAMSNVVRRNDGTVHQGICYNIYTEAESYKKFYCATYEELLGEDPDLYDLTSGADQLRSWLTDTSGWAFGVSWQNDTYGEGVSFIRRFLLSYFRWTWQRILVPTAYTPSRAERKWVSRIKPPLKDGQIKVLRLRREVEHERRGSGEYQGVYDHQFIVRGFWRRQHYRSLGPAKVNGEFNPDSHRLVWIEPFVKGNPNGPLVVGHNVVAAVR